MNEWTEWKPSLKQRRQFVRLICAQLTKDSGHALNTTNEEARTPPNHGVFSYFEQSISCSPSLFTDVKPIRFHSFNHRNHAHTKEIRNTIILSWNALNSKRRTKRAIYISKLPRKFSEANVTPRKNAVNNRGTPSTTTSLRPRSSTDPEEYGEASEIWRDRVAYNQVQHSRGRRTCSRSRILASRRRKSPRNQRHPS